VEEASHDKELQWIAGAFGPTDRVPLLEGLIGHGLLDMVAIACSTLGFPSGIFQNDGTLFPRIERIKLFRKYCQEIRSTNKGRDRCRACDCQAVINFTGGDKAPLKPDLEKVIKRFPIERIEKFGLPKEQVTCYRCHAGLLELVRPISLDFKDGAPTPVGAIWAGQNKVEGYHFSEGQVRQFAKEIDYQDAGKLLKLYEKIAFTSRENLTKRAKSLAETATPIEDSVSAVFHNEKRVQYGQLIVALLSSLRKSLSDVKAIAAGSIQEQVYMAMEPVVREIADNIGNCYSALCEIPASVREAKESRVKVTVVAHAGLQNRKQPKTYHINPRQPDIDRLLCELEGAGELKLFPPRNLDLEVFRKLERAVGLRNITHAVVAYVPSQQDQTRILWVTLLCQNCDVLTPRGTPSPDFIEMMDEISQHASPIINMAYLLARQRDAVRILKKQKGELEHNRKQIQLLIRNLAHQVSRPIMELKQAAYILSAKGFSKRAYENFRACLAEMERGARNFDIYEELRTGFDGKEDGFHVPHSFHVQNIFEEASDRIRPYLTGQRRELYVERSLETLSNIPRIKGNEGAFVECLVNVLHNAIKYSIGSHPVEVDIRYNQSSKMVEIRVSNYGVQIPESDRARIFDEAYRSDTAKAVAIEGSGVGLYISHRLTELHGGTLEMESSTAAKPTDDGRPRWKTTFVIAFRT
jgi:signal transduction histidine kinase/ligand-binding sensor protein